MPAIILRTSVKCTDEQKDFLARGLSKICADALGKPELYVMSVVQDGATIFFGGNKQMAVILDVKSIGGLNAAVNAALSKAICDFLSETINIEPNSIYINFADVARENWGWNSTTFA